MPGQLRLSGLTEALCLSGLTEALCLSGLTEALCLSGLTEALCLSGLTEALSLSGLTEALCLSGLTEALCLSGLTEALCLSGLTEALCLSWRRPQLQLSLTSSLVVSSSCNGGEFHCSMVSFAWAGTKGDNRRLAACSCLPSDFNGPVELQSLPARLPFWPEMAHQPPSSGSPSVHPPLVEF